MRKEKWNFVFHICFLFSVSFFLFPSTQAAALTTYTSTIINSVNETYVTYDSITGTVYAVSDGPGNTIGLYKYSLDLVLQSSSSFTGPVGDSDVRDIAVTSNGTIYITGYVQPTNGDRHIWVGRFDSSLVIQSSATFNGNGSAAAEYGNKIALASDGSVYVVGTVGDIVNTNLWVGKYNASLTVLQSSAAFLSVNGNNEFGSDISLDATGNVYIVGQVNSTGWIGKYTDQLVLISSMTTTGYMTEAISISGDTVYVTGQSTASGNSFVGKYDTSLVLQSSVVLSGFLAGYDVLTYDLVVDSQQKIFAVGELYQAGTDTLLAVQLNSALAVVSSATISSTANHEAYSVALGNARYIFVGGVSSGTGWISRHQIGGTATTTIDSIRAYPNPFIPGQGTSDIIFDRLPAGAKVQVFSLTGSLIAELTADDSGVATWVGVKNQSGEKVASGVYYVFAEGNGSKKTTKVAIER